VEPFETADVVAELVQHGDTTLVRIVFPRSGEVS
jgi:hypothetical protein